MAVVTFTRWANAIWDLTCSFSPRRVDIRPKQLQTTGYCAGAAHSAQSSTLVETARVRTRKDTDFDRIAKTSVIYLAARTTTTFARNGQICQPARGKQKSESSELIGLVLKWVDIFDAEKVIKGKSDELTATGLDGNEIAGNGVGTFVYGVLVAC